MAQAGALLVDGADETEPRPVRGHGNEQCDGKDREHSAKATAERNHGCNPLCGRTNLIPRPPGKSNFSAKKLDRIKRGNCRPASPYTETFEARGWWRPLSRGLGVRWERGSGGEVQGEGVTRTRTC